MRFIGTIIVSVFANIVALLAADHFVFDFSFTGDFLDLFMLAVILTTINIFLMPFIRFLFGPLIILSFGLFIIILNATAIYTLDILSFSLTIGGYIPLLIATFIIGIINTVISFGARIKYKK